MPASKETIAEVGSNPDARTRQRSTIGFPYMSLDAAITLARAVHDNVSRGDCDDNQLAAWTQQSSKSSTFRVQVSAARTFGLLEGEAGTHRLTPLGLSIVDPNQEREAKVRAFLNVPLFKAVYDEYKAGTVPPPTAIERDMARLGVSEKQTGRARVSFEKSAELAGFFEHGRNRLVMPGLSAPVQTKAPPAIKEDEPHSEVARGSSGGGGLDPVIAALIQKLPKGKDDWPVDQRVTWLQMIAMAFDLAYGPGAPISITKGAVSAS